MIENVFIHKIDQNFMIFPNFTLIMILVGWLVFFYGISTIVGYLMSNALYTSCIWFVNA